MRSWELLDQSDDRRGREVWNEFTASIVLVRFQLNSRYLSRIIVISPKLNRSSLIVFFINVKGFEFVLIYSVELEREGWRSKVVAFSRTLIVNNVSTRTYNLTVSWETANNEQHQPTCRHPAPAPTKLQPLPAWSIQHQTSTHPQNRKRKRFRNHHLALQGVEATWQQPAPHDSKQNPNRTCTYPSPERQPILHHSLENYNHSYHHSRMARDRSRLRHVKLCQQLHNSQRSNIDNSPRQYHQQLHQPSAIRKTDRQPRGQLRRRMAHLSRQILWSNVMHDWHLRQRPPRWSQLDEIRGDACARGRLPGRHSGENSSGNQASQIRIWR